MSTEPIITIRKSTHDLAILIAGNVYATQLPEETERYFLENKGEVIPAILRGFVIQKEVKVEISTPQPPNLTNTGHTFADWLTARERVHDFLTGEAINLRGMFMVPNDLLTRTDIIPVFRPAGATNRVAMDWKVKLGMCASYEETNVMEYKNSKGPQVFKLYYINKSVRPDEDTLGEKAMSPDQLVATGKNWLNLYGWSDADNLYSLITGTHLDSGETWTWFPNDRLSGGLDVAHGCWNMSTAQARFGWFYRDGCTPDIGARVAIPLSLRT